MDEETVKLALITGATHEQSMTHNQVPPDDARYVTVPAADAIVVTNDWATRAVHALGEDPRPKVLWLQESRWLTSLWHDLPRRFYSAVLSNQKDYCARGARYMTLFGTWILDTEPRAKTRTASFIASNKDGRAVRGYITRRSVAKLRLIPEQDCYGKLFDRWVPNKEDALHPYMFSVAVESERYPWWHTEKLFDCFATKTVPVYWGCNDFSKLKEWGFDPEGIIPFADARHLPPLIPKLTEATYERMRPSIERNYRRTLELRCAEIALHKVVEEALGGREKVDTESDQASRCAS